MRPALARLIPCRPQALRRVLEVTAAAGSVPCCHRLRLAVDRSDRSHEIPPTARLGRAFGQLDAPCPFLPIPLSAERLAERGYNQSLLLARQLSPQKTQAELLLRTRHTPVQRTLPRAERLANLNGAFAVEPLRAAEVRGRTVLLVDDVMTSGASLHTAAQALREAGARHISAVVLARTEAATE